MCVRPEYIYSCGCKKRGDNQMCKGEPRCVKIDVFVIQEGYACDVCAGTQTFVFVDEDGKLSEQMQAKRRKTNH